MQPNLEAMTRSALIGALQDARRTAAFYSQAALRYPRPIAYGELARTEQRFETLLLGVCKQLRVPPPKPPERPVVPRAALATVRAAVALETESLANVERYRGFVKDRAFLDVLTLIQATIREKHLPQLKKHLSPDPPKPSLDTIRKLRGR